MDRVVIEQKLEALRRCLHRIEEKCPSDPGTLARDPDLQDILTINLTRAVQICVDIGTSVIATLEVPAPDTMGDTFDVLASSEIIGQELANQLKKAVGFRNIAVHAYEEIDWSIAHAIALHHRNDFTRFAEAIWAHL